MPPTSKAERYERLVVRGGQLLTKLLDTAEELRKVQCGAAQLSAELKAKGKHVPTVEEMEATE